MTNCTVLGSKGFMTDRVKEILLRPAVRIMAGDTRTGAGFNPFVGSGEARRPLIMATRA